VLNRFLVLMVHPGIVRLIGTVVILDVWQLGVISSVQNLRWQPAAAS